MDSSVVRYDWFSLPTIILSAFENILRNSSKTLLGCHSSRQRTVKILFLNRYPQRSLGSPLFILIRTVFTSLLFRFRGFLCVYVCLRQLCSTMGMLVGLQTGKTHRFRSRQARSQHQPQHKLVMCTRETPGGPRSHRPARECVQKRSHCNTGHNPTFKHIMGKMQHCQDYT